MICKRLQNQDMALSKNFSLVTKNYPLYNVIRQIALKIAAYQNKKGEKKIVVLKD